MDLWIFDKDSLERVGIIDTYNTLMWNRKYFDTGDFELYLPLTTDNLILLKKGNIICKTDNLKECAYITYRNLKETDNGEEKLIIKGKFLKGLLSKRIIWNPTILNYKAEICIRKLVEENCISPAIVNRKLDNLVLSNIKNFGQTLDYQVSYKNLLEEINKISLITNLSVDIKADIGTKDNKVCIKNFILDICEGLDRTAGQTINTQAIFSQEFDNVLNQNYIDSDNNYKNTALIKGQGEGETRVTKILNNGNKGLERNEIFVDARDTEMESELTTRGQKVLDENKEIKTFDSVVNTHSNLTYKIDYDLGDIVTFKTKKWDLQLDSRITEIQEVYDQNGFNINCTFGNKIPNLIDKIKQLKNN